MRARSTFTRSRRPARQEEGIALLVVLWFVALLTLLATSAVALSQLHRRAAETLGDEIRAETAADSAIRVLLLQLAGRGQTWATWLGGGTRTMEIAGAHVGIRVELEDGRIDLNTADTQLLYAFFAANGWSEADATAFVARIEDWISAADHLHPGGAELRDYEAIGRSYGPRSAPFESVAELRQVLGGERVSPELMSALTVYTHSRYPLQATAPSPVQRALRWADERRLESRRWVVDDAQQSSLSLDSSVDMSGVGRLVRISACASYAHARRCKVAVARLTGNNQSSFEIFLWE